MLFSSIPVASAVGNEFQFDIGTLALYESGTFHITAFMDCASVPGQSHWMEARIYPDSNCIQPAPSWNGAKVELEVNCLLGDSVEFIVQNTGTGNMLAPGGYIIVEDNLLRMDTALQLNIGENWRHVKVANGSTWVFTGLRFKATRAQPSPERS